MGGKHGFECTKSEEEDKKMRVIVAAGKENDGWMKRDRTQRMCCVVYAIRFLQLTQLILSFRI